MQPTTRRAFIQSALAAAFAGCACPSIGSEQQATNTPPNLVIIYVDDMAYADLGCYGSKSIQTPHIDRLAKEGVRFTDFYAAQAVCSASRASLLTGCYPNRVGIAGALGPKTKVGISDDEMTLAQMLKQKDYATAIFGKWHLGDSPQFLPTRHGFDEYFGLPYSNDMWPKHPENPTAYPPLPLIEGDKVIQTNPDQTQLATWYTERAVRFIERNATRPFFLYVAHNMPHVPLHVSDKFKGKSAAGLYGDVIQEIDWSVGQVLAALRQHGLDKNTLVIFASDNGPWLSYGDHAGSAGPLREGKHTTFDGGVRVPCIMRLPGRIPAGKTCATPAMTIDILPTVAALTGAKLPPRKIDGQDIWPVITGKTRQSPQEAYYFYQGAALQAVRSGPWKLHFPHSYQSIVNAPPATGGIPTKYKQGKIELVLFNLEKDPGETTNIAQQHPDVVSRLQALADKMRQDLGDSARNVKGTGIRPAGRLVG